MADTNPDQAGQKAATTAKKFGENSQRIFFAFKDMISQLWFINIQKKDKIINKMIEYIDIYPW